ncbi:MAG: hypothetical protein R3E12_03370 [Candidatus Eisenbacteria bacterium]
MQNLGSKMILDATRSGGTKPIDARRLPRLPRDRTKRRPAAMVRRVLPHPPAGGNHSRTPGAGAAPPHPSLVWRSAAGAGERGRGWTIPAIASGILTRFDAARDVLFRETCLVGASPVHRGTLGIDATWKEGYPAPVVCDDDTDALVTRRWSEYGLDGIGA